MTSAEKVLWVFLRRKQISGYKFRRQFSVLGFVLDFYCPQLKLAIEVDGSSHDGEDRKIYDKQRQNLIELLGIRFLRFTNDDVFSHTGKVLEEIENVVRTPSGSPP